MKFWEKLRPEQLKNSETKTRWWCPWTAFGFVIGLAAIALIVALVFLFLGWVFSFLWNYAVAHTFNISELTTYSAAVLLLLIFWIFRFIKWVLA
jgi:hypothetical protein